MTSHSASVKSPCAVPHVRTIPAGSGSTTRNYPTPTPETGQSAPLPAPTMRTASQGSSGRSPGELDRWPRSAITRRRGRRRRRRTWRGSTARRSPLGAENRRPRRTAGSTRPAHRDLITTADDVLRSLPTTRAAPNRPVYPPPALTTNHTNTPWAPRFWSVDRKPYNSEHSRLVRVARCGGVTQSQVVVGQVAVCS